ncbi:hypothetical protein [Nonomuraea jabiensis]|uniref:hypothetical protein n=1 Tax=Nonomuraea jabiensis TaxID=882448 RepID=UPI003D748865
MALAVSAPEIEPRREGGGSNSELALAVLFYATIALWFMATVRHASMASKAETLR